jgi:transposase-like protein
MYKKTEPYFSENHKIWFDNEKKCHDFLVKIKWNGNPKCDKCNNANGNYYFSTRNIYKCSNCRRQFSIMKGTIFENSKISLQKWFLLIYIFKVTKGNVSSIQMSKYLNVKQNTTWSMLKRFNKNSTKEHKKIIDEIKKTNEDYAKNLNIFSEESYFIINYISLDKLKELVKLHGIKTKKQFYEFRKQYE